MAIVAADIEVRYSGGSANTDPNAALGGAISTSGSGTVDDNVANDLFDNVSSAEQVAGDVEYRGIYCKNNHGSLTLQDARAYITSFAELDIALASEAVNTSMATIANESTAPVGPTFSHPSSYASGLQLNSSTGLTAGSYKGLWVRRTIASGASPGTRNTETLNFEGATL